jgi:hypothetical protein
MLEITEALDKALAELVAARPDAALWSGASAVACDEQVTRLVADLTRWREQLIEIDLSHILVTL